VNGVVEKPWPSTSATFDLSNLRDELADERDVTTSC
jgi:hypothetical protein